MKLFVNTAADATANLTVSVQDVAAREMQSLFYGDYLPLEITLHDGAGQTTASLANADISVAVGDLETGVKYYTQTQTASNSVANFVLDLAGASFETLTNGIESADATFEIQADLGSNSFTLHQSTVKIFNQILNKENVVLTEPAAPSNVATEILPLPDAPSEVIVASSPASPSNIQTEKLLTEPAAPSNVEIEIATVPLAPSNVTTEASPAAPSNISVVSGEIAATPSETLAAPMLDWDYNGTIVKVPQAYRFQGTSAYAGLNDKVFAWDGSTLENGAPVYICSGDNCQSGSNGIEKIYANNVYSNTIEWRLYFHAVAGGFDGSNTTLGLASNNFPLNHYNLSFYESTGSQGIVKFLPSFKPTAPVAPSSIFAEVEAAAPTQTQAKEVWAVQTPDFSTDSWDGLNKLIIFLEAASSTYPDPDFSLPSEPNNNNDYIFPSNARPLIIALTTRSSKSLVQGESYRLTRFRVSNTNAQIANLDGTNLRWIGARGTTWEILTSGNQDVQVGTIARTTGISEKTISWANSNTGTGTVNLDNRGINWEFVEFTDQKPDFFKQVVESVVLKVTGMSNVTDPYYGTFNVNGFYKVASSKKGTYYDGEFELIPNAINPAFVYEKVIDSDCQETTKTVFLYKYIHEGSDYLLTRWEFGRTFPTLRDDLMFVNATEATGDTPFAESWATESNNECPTKPTPPSDVSVSTLTQPSSPSNVEIELIPPIAPFNVTSTILPTDFVTSFRLQAAEQINYEYAAAITGHIQSPAAKYATATYTWQTNLKDASGNTISGYKRTQGANLDSRLDHDYIRFETYQTITGKALFYTFHPTAKKQLSNAGESFPASRPASTPELFWRDINWYNVDIIPMPPAAPSNVQATLPPPSGVYSFWLYASQTLTGADASPIIRLNTSSAQKDQGAQYVWTSAGLSLNGGVTYSGWRRMAGSNLVNSMTQDFIYIHPTRGFEYWSGVALRNFDIENFPTLPTGDNSFPFGTSNKYYFKNVSLTP